MAEAPASLRARQAALLLQCQQLRASRLKAEVARLGVEADEAQARAGDSQAALERHAADTRQSLRREYDGLLGKSVDLLAFQALRGREASAVAQQAQLAQDRDLARGELEETTRDKLAAERESAIGERQVARRERIHDVASADAVRQQAKREALQEEDEHSLLHARKT